jgi:hypothetical protein
MQAHRRILAESQERSAHQFWRGWTRASGLFLVPTDGVLGWRGDVDPRK